MRNRILAGLALVAVFFIGGFTFQSSKPAAYEYKIESGIYEKGFNSLGAAGWELVSCGSMNGGLPYCVFKRQLPR